MKKLKINKGEIIKIRKNSESFTDNIETIVNEIILSVKDNGDKAIIEYTKKFDNIELREIKVSEGKINLASKNIDEKLIDAIDIAYNNIYNFHSLQLPKNIEIENKGAKCWRKAVPIEKVGLYIPGGTAPLFSTVLMLGIPAKIAGCKEVVLCSPPNKNGSIDSSILYSAKKIGIEKIFCVGGAQAIAAMAYGTETIPNVYKIFGPGNKYVTLAKQILSKTKISIDMPAGPSELLIIADETAIPEFVAADLLSQAEHDYDSMVILVSTSQMIIEQTITQLELQIEKLPRKDIARNVINNGYAILADSIDTSIDISNEYAPEHLIIATKDALEQSKKVTNAGSVFIGNYSTESLGDYASGTNHTLPTYGFAKSYSGVTLESFMKYISFQYTDENGIIKLGPAVEVMAEKENLFAHKNAVTVRLNYLKNNN